MDETEIYAYGYVRVSSLEQNLDRQISLIEKYLDEKKYKKGKMFEDKISSFVNFKARPGSSALVNYLRPGEIVVIESLSRLARNLREIHIILEFLEKKEVKVVSLKEQIDTSTPSGRLMLNMFASLAEFEVDTLKERQREGIAKRKEKKLYKGREYVRMPENFYLAFEKYNNASKKNPYSLVDFAKETNLKRSSLIKIISEVKTNSIHPDRLITKKKKEKEKEKGQGQEKEEE
jgi:DNA invertase Pin-like site-specific DNA recombinase